MNSIGMFALGVGAAALAAIVAVPAQAQFYKGKTLNVLINYGAGGNTDIQGRSVLRFMENYIEGKPRTVVRNMGGAGGIVGTNYLGRDVKPDGMMMGIFTIAFMGELLADPALTVSHRDFIYIGAIGQQQIAHIRKDVPPGIARPTDIFKVTQPFKSAGHAPSSSKDISIKLTLDLLGVPYDHVTGMRDAGVIRRAILQNNIQFTEDSLTGFYAGVQPTLIEPGISIPLWHTGVPTPDGGMKHAPTVSKDIPPFLAIYQAKHGEGKRPQGLAWEAYRKQALSRQVLRVLVLPKGSPPEAVAALRTAWKKTTEDKGYLEEYRKQNNSDLEALIGEEAQKIVSDLVDVSPELRAFLQKLAKS